MRSSTGIVAAALAAIVGITPAAAQTASRIGPSITAIATGTRGTNSAYDFKNGQYLVVSAYGNLNGVFVTADGVPGAPFLLQTPGLYTHFPAVAYSPDLFGGAGGFLVTWHQSLGEGAVVHARLVTTTGVLAPEIQVSIAGSWWEAAVDVAYSTASKEFLVVWQGAGITGQRIDLNGQPIGGNFQLTPAGGYRRDPAVVYNPTTNQFMVSFGGEDNVSPFAGFQRVAAGSGALVGPETVVGRARVVYISEVAYNSTTNQYLVAWNQLAAYGVLVDANGNVLTNATLLSTTVNAYDALGIDYNASSGTFMMVSHRQDSQQDGGVEISAGLVPDVPIVATDAAPPTAGNFYPKVSSRVGAPQWLLTTATGFGATTVQRLGTTATGGGVGGPPPPPPPNPVGAATAAKDDFSLDGRADIVWQRNDGYLSVWAMNGTTAVSSKFLNPVIVEPRWRIVATGDFNGDRMPDL
ncbi:MAG TPA: VCBS repeat-containing protein, partial [Vicinamibacterales bacterium]|nr:VCBS repeat-containing protein [Vicinamibacterales bacterium]